MKIHSLETGFFSTDGGAMFGMVSKKVWASKYPVDEENRCPLSMRALYAEINGHKINNVYAYFTGICKECKK